MRPLSPPVLFPLSCLACQRCAKRPRSRFWAEAEAEAVSEACCFEVTRLCEPEVGATDSEPVGALEATTVIGEVEFGELPCCGRSVPFRDRSSIACWFSTVLYTLGSSDWRIVPFTEE